MSLGLGALPSGLLAHILCAFRNMLAETSSPVDDVESETNEVGMESYHGSEKVGDAVY